MSQEQPLVSFIAPIFNYYPIILPSLICQTYQNWHLLLIHDSPSEDLEKLLFKYQESRARYMHTEERFNDYGHTLRQVGLDNLPYDSDFVCITNGDNYVAPQFIQMMIEPMLKNPAIMATYCDFVNNLYFTQSRLELGWTNTGNVVVRTAVAKSVGWKSKVFAADFLYVNDVMNKVGAQNIVKVNRTLFFHN